MVFKCSKHNNIRIKYDSPKNYTSINDYIRNESEKYIISLLNFISESEFKLEQKSENH